MPELPEVETIRQYLRLGHGESPPVLGRRIEQAHLLWERTLATPSPDNFAQRIQGQIIREIGRRGKHLLIYLDIDTLILHLRMSGDVLVKPGDAPAGPYDRLILDLEGDLRLVFQDTRKFGRAWLVSSEDEVVQHLGPEPFDSQFTPEWLFENLQKRQRQLKPLLLDQTFIAGLGNIYTDEALHRAHLHPLQRSDRVSQESARSLWESIRQVLAEGIQRSGASIDWVYRGGDFQNYFQVYQRGGSPCFTCGTIIEKITVGQRGTHFCPHCQPEPQTEE